MVPGTQQDYLWTGLRPGTYLIETGTHHGGSALYFAMVAQMAKFPLDVVTIDFNPKLAYEPAAYHIHSVRGISTTSNTIDQVKTIHDRLASQ